MAVRRLADAERWIALLAILLAGCAHPTVAPLGASPISPRSDERLAVDEIFLVVDTSSSTEPDFPRLKAILDSFVAAMPDGSYDAGAIAFGGYERQVIRPEPFDRARFRKQVEDLGLLMGGSPLDQVLREVESGLRPGQRRIAILLFSDGGLTDPIGREVEAQRLFNEARRLVERVGGQVCFHTVQIGEDPRGAAILSKLARTTSCGSAYSSGSIANVAALQGFEREVFLHQRPSAVAAAPFDWESEALSARDAALAAGALDASPTKLHMADDLYEIGTEARDAGLRGDAQDAFRRAAQEYQGARKVAEAQATRAIAARARASAARSALIASVAATDRDDCEALGGAVREHCRAGDRWLTVGDDALAGAKPRTARESFEQAGLRFVAARQPREARPVAEVSPPLPEELEPPRIVSRSPSETLLRVEPGEMIELRVDAVAPEGETLSYAWTSDGARLSSGGPTVRLEATQGMEIRVTVASPSGRDTAVWRTIEVEPVSASPSQVAGQSGEVRGPPGPTREHELDWLLLALGISLLLLMVIVSFRLPHPTEFQAYVLRVTTSIAAALSSSALPGLMELHLEPFLGTGSLQATGGLAMFAIVYGLNPGEFGKGEQKPS